MRLIDAETLKNRILEIYPIDIGGEAVQKAVIRTVDDAPTMIVIGMEMPKNCRKCPMNQGEYTQNEIEKRYCCLTHRQFSKGDYEKRPTSCPMKELK